MMCRPPKPATMSAVAHAAGANNVQAPRSMNAAPMTGTMRHRVRARGDDAGPVEQHPAARQQRLETTVHKHRRQQDADEHRRREAEYELANWPGEKRHTCRASLHGHEQNGNAGARAASTSHVMTQPETAET